MSAGGQRGFILISVLWLIAALAALASAYSVFAVNTAASAYLPEDRVRAEAAIRAGVELTAYRLLSWPKETRPARGGFAFALPDARVVVEYRAETARIDVNAAPPAVLSGLFAAVGATHAQADFLAQRIAGWRGQLQDADKQAELAFYRKAGLTYGPLGAPFDNLSEIALLPGASPTLVARATPYLTIFNGSSKINPLIADPITLSALPGATTKIVKDLTALASAGNLPNSSALAALAGPVKDFVSADPAEKVRATIVVTSPRRRTSAEVVIGVDKKQGEEQNNADPYQLLFWRDDFDGGE
jgi:general secretion pathway protein K